MRPPTQDTTRLWYSVHGDDHVGLGAEVGLEWYRQQVSKRFIMKLRGDLGPAGHHKREMRILNHGRDHIRRRPTTRHTKETHDTWTSCCVTMAWSTGRAGRVQYLGTSPRFFGKEPACRRLPAS